MEVHQQTSIGMIFSSLAQSIFFFTQYAWWCNTVLQLEPLILIIFWKRETHFQCYFNCIWIWQSEFNKCNGQWHQGLIVASWVMFICHVEVKIMQKWNTKLFIFLMFIIERFFVPAWLDSEFAFWTSGFGEQLEQGIITSILCRSVVPSQKGWLDIYIPARVYLGLQAVVI